MTGVSGGTPGLTTTSEDRSTRSMLCVPRSTATCSRSSAAPVSWSVGVFALSEAYTVWPLRASRVATARPLRANPMTAISRSVQSALSAGVETRGAIISSQLERAQGNDGEEDRDDPEPDDDLRLVPAL